MRDMILNIPWPWERGWGPTVQSIFYSMPLLQEVWIFCKSFNLNVDFQCFKGNFFFWRFEMSKTSAGILSSIKLTLSTEQKNRNIFNVYYFLRNSTLHLLETTMVQFCLFLIKTASSKPLASYSPPLKLMWNVLFTFDLSCPADTSCKRFCKQSVIHVTSQPRVNL